MIDTSARLIAVSYAGEFGLAQRVETTTEIFCSISSVNRAEFFAAYDSGFRPEFRVTTAPVNYAGQGIIELDTPEGPVRCDVYRTYRKSPDALELWCCRKNEEAVQIFTLWTAGKRVTLFGAYLSGSDGAQRTRTGQIATDTVSLILPQTLQAFVGETPVAYCRPKAYEMMSETDKAAHFYIDAGCFFALGDVNPALLFAPKDYDGVETSDHFLFAAADIPANLKYQEINALFDDVWRVQSVDRKNRGKPDTEYLEVVGK